MKVKSITYNSMRLRAANNPYDDANLGLSMELEKLGGDSKTNTVTEYVHSFSIAGTNDNKYVEDIILITKTTKYEDKE